MQNEQIAAQNMTIDRLMQLIENIQTNNNNGIQNLNESLTGKIEELNIILNNPDESKVMALDLKLNETIQNLDNVNITVNTELTSIKHPTNSDYSESRHCNNQYWPYQYNTTGVHS